MSLQSGYFRKVSFNINFRFLSIIGMHQMDKKLLSYLMLMTVSILYTSEAL